VCAFLISHIEFYFISSGILKRECGVLPPGSNNAAIPDEATASGTFPLLLIKFSTVVHKKVLLVPPYPKTKKVFPSLLRTELHIASKTVVWQLLSLCISFSVDDDNRFVS
jgi:hypothetical protein